MINVVKIGGNVIDSPEALESFLDDFARMPSPKILVHGGGRAASRLCRDLGIEPVMVNGRRVTDAATLDIVTMVYAGLVNKRIAASLQARGVNAVGLCGADGALIPARRRSPLPVDYGFVGDIDAGKINTDTLRSLLDAGMTPVLCAITMCDDPAEGLLLNTNADSVACAVAVASARLDEVVMHYCFEMPGVMRDVADPDSVIDRIDRRSFETLRAEKIIHSGMLPKIENALTAVESGVRSVVIKSSTALNADAGTRICP